MRRIPEQQKLVSLSIELNASSINVSESRSFRFGLNFPLQTGTTYEQMNIYTYLILDNKVNHVLLQPVVE